ncbi:hypothetical protein N7535_004093 [Penicillium sp. DV-2018c]|nr:hypothetical protein N7461_000201 [Penicillium sp. DV-2018c]KAJ5577167.1 hypothetical protein N7535_004093 [Penicillium sp. DV-2018c]
MATETSPRSSPGPYTGIPMEDVLIQVRNLKDTKTTLFWLRSYLPGFTNPDEQIDTRILNYSKFEADLTAHFGYDPLRDEIAWENIIPKRPHITAGRDAFYRPLNANYSLVWDLESWVEAVHSMAHANYAWVRHAEDCPVKTMVYFTIVRYKDDPDYAPSDADNEYDSYDDDSDDDDSTDEDEDEDEELGDCSEDEMS